VNTRVVHIDINDTQLMEVVKQIRIEVFVKEQNVSPEGDWDGMKSENYLVYLENKPVGTMRWRDHGKEVKIERVSVLAPYRQRGLASLMIKQALKDIRLHTKKPILLHSQLKAIPLYERFGFVAFGEKFLEEGIEHYSMLKRD
jgi:predicted GNAT family N-acyltransferase